MKWSIIKRSALFFLFVSSGTPVFCQEMVASGEPKLLRQEKRDERYTHRQEQYREFWMNLIPTHATLQYAGSIGVFSTGPGWDYGRRDQWATDFMIGYIPRFSGKEGAVTLSLKETYTPWQVPIARGWTFAPLTGGILVNSVLDNHFWGREPDRYPSNYYKFSTRVRFHAFLGQAFTVRLSERVPSRTLTFYYEISSCDLYVISAATNRYVKPGDILSLALGVKFGLY